ncbi:MAG: hypothetical protein IKW78_07310 [Prevotella sp.]|nr:hypothetical protein [Prevotella sp.]
MTKGFFMLLAAVLLSSANMFAQSNELLKGDVNGDGVVDVADIVAVIDIIEKGQNSETTYYWYVGQTDPSTMSSIGPVVTSYENGGGWYELGTTVPETIQQLVKGGDSTKSWYTAVPITSGTTLKPVASDMTTLDTSVSVGATKTFDGITYQTYSYGTPAARNTFRFAKK